MADEYTATNPQTGEQVKWDGKAWVPVPAPGYFATTGKDMLSMVKPLVGMGGPQYVEPDAFKRQFEAMTPEQKKAQIEKTRSTLAGMPYSDIQSQSVRDYQARREAGQSLPRAMAEGTYQGAFGANMQDFDAALKKGNIREALGHLSAPIALLAATHGVGKLAENVPLNEMARRQVAGLFDVGENFEQRALREHQAAIDTINRAYEEKIQKTGEKTSENEAAYRTELEQARDDYAQKIAQNEQKKVAASAKQSGAETKRKSLTTQPRSGPVYQRMAGMADKLATQDVPTLDKDVRTAQNNRWSAFRQAITKKDPVTGNPVPVMVDWTPVQEAVVDAETNILQGSPENIATFRNILREGVDPTLEKATVFKRTGGALEDILKSKNLTEEGRARLLKQLGDEAQFEDRGGSGPAAKQNVQIPFEDARGYYTELGEKIAKSRSIPGDVRRALKSVQDAADRQIKASMPKDQVPTYERLKSDWAQYMGDFYDSDGPLSQLKNAATSDGRLNLITGSNGANIIDALGRYSMFNPNVTGMAGRLRSLMKQVRELPSVAPSIPGRLRPPSFPREPEPINISERPSTTEPLDITREKLQAPEKMPKTWGTLRPYQAVIPYYWPRLAAQKLIAELLSHPALREWIAGAKK